MLFIILISCWQFLSSRCQIRRGYVTAKHIVKSQNTCKSCRLVKSVNVFEKEGKHLAVNRQQSPLWAAKVLFTTKTNGYGKLKNMNANRIQVKSSRLKLVHWSRSKSRLEGAEEERLQHRQCPSATNCLLLTAPAFLSWACLQTWL